MPWVGSCPPVCKHSNSSSLLLLTLLLILLLLTPSRCLPWPRTPSRYWYVLVVCLEVPAKIKSRCLLKENQNIPKPTHPLDILHLSLPFFSLCTQCNPGAIYNTSYGTQPHYSQPRLAPHSAQELHPKHYPKPIYSYR